MKLDKTTWKAIAGAITAILAAIGAALGFSSCGVTKASIVTPREGSTTSITISTNMPITTQVDPATSVDYK